MLAARRVGLLEEVAQECRVLGAEVHVVATDVTDGNLFTPVERGRGVRGGFRTPLPAWTGPVAMAGLTVAAAAAYSAFVHRR